MLKNYNKAQALNNQIKVKVTSYAKQMNDKKEEIQKAQTELANQAQVLRLAGLYGQINQKVKAGDTKGAQDLYQPFVDDRTLLFIYTASGLVAGLAGVIFVSRVSTMVAFAVTSTCSESDPSCIVTLT